MSDPSTSSTASTCPACGKTIPETGSCCDFAVTEALERIPATAELVIDITGERIPIDLRWLRIGRDEANQIIVKDDFYASRFHAWVTFDEGSFWVEDLGSTNGTLLNGNILDTREILRPGDKIKIGETELTFALLEKTG